MTHPAPLHTTRQAAPFAPVAAAVFTALARVGNVELPVGALPADTAQYRIILPGNACALFLVTGQGGDSTVQIDCPALAQTPPTISPDAIKQLYRAAEAVYGELGVMMTDPATYLSTYGVTVQALA